ncbi:NUDIX hydrolase [Nocardia puris]|uniref:8-oxo-dGTP diphosphatase n=1 Tax=Nocardia puris TaxID=208602 RepID=A0A366DCS1_9NOCA|nr:NUDIX hydrolase [Nocardia puris]MBF6364863.1 NUDIX hydrolase [Nocardia puris]MBF6458649.1 NUDIX hydrolase [Nocardia puris]RBO87851.1 8-oxo-dGTP diphosphatase [Nocardia puris]
MRGDGDGWSLGPGGTKHWGRFGAAGLLLRAPLAGGGSAVLLQHRAPWSHQGGTWALPGGARDSHETALHAAVREAWEEAGIQPTDVRVRGERVTAGVTGGWTYTTVVADAVATLPTSRNRESTELAWVPEDEVATRPLHPAFAEAWPALRAAPARACLAGLTDAHTVAAALPRTLDLADQGFVWLHTVRDGPGGYARITDEEGVSVETPSAGKEFEPVLSLTMRQVLASLSQ